LFANAVDLFLDGQSVERLQRQAEEQPDTAIECEESFAKCTLDLIP